MAVREETKKAITCDTCGAQEIVLDNQTRTIKETPCAVRQVRYTDEYGFIFDKKDGYLSVEKLDLCPECRAIAHSTVVGETTGRLVSTFDYTFIGQEE